MSGTCVAYVWNMCGICAAHVWNVCGTCVAHVPHMFGTCVAHVSHMFGTCAAHAWHICGTCVAHVWHMCGTCVAMCSTCVAPESHGFYHESGMQLTNDVKLPAMDAMKITTALHFENANPILVIASENQCTETGDSAALWL